jgi:hypothetical protein
VPVLFASILLPKRLVEALEARGLDVVDIIVNALRDELDPRIVAEARVELAERLLDEAREYVRKGDAVQASEKMYRVAEGCIKALAEALQVKEAEEARKREKWSSWLLGEAAKSIADELNEQKVLEAWAIAYDVHVWGFHEAKYSIERVAVGLKYMELLLNTTKRVIGKSEAER